ncbi:MAG: tetratricopeptide repeat protein [bacterium]|nr:tetratricopeptide repeat protein [bacterium]MDA1024622.1 tetratricopeptide repeat protein [bacterium]
MKNMKQVKIAEWFLIGIGALAPLCALVLPRAIADTAALTVFTLGSLALFAYTFRFERKFPLHGWWLLPASLFFLSLVVSTITSITPFESVVAIGRSGHLSLIFTASVGVYLFSLASLPSEAKSRALPVVIRLLQLVLSVALVIQMLGGPAFSITPISLIGVLLIMTFYGFGRDVSQGRAQSSVAQRCERAVSAVSSIVVGVSLFSLDAQVMWVLAGVGALVFAVLYRKWLSDVILTGVISFILIVAIFFFARSPVPTFFPIEITPHANIAMQVATESLAHTSWLFGAGGGSYGALYDLYRPGEINQTPIWDLAFDRLTSHVLTILPQYGILGTLLFLLTCIFILIEVWRHHHRTTEYAAPLALTLFFLSLWLYPSNSFSYIVFVFLLVLTFDRVLESKPARGRLPTVMTGAVSVLLLIAQISGGLGVIIGAYSSAGWLRTFSPYDMNRSIAYAARIEQNLQKDMTTTEDASVYASDVEAIIAALHYGDAVKNNRRQLEAIARVYTQMSTYVEGTDEIAASVLEDAVKAAPHNPRLWTELALQYGTVSARIDDAAVQQTLREAERAALQEALRLLPAYLPALYRSAVVMAEDGDINGAIEALERLVKRYPTVSEVHFELGLLYLEQKEYLPAKDAFLTVIQRGGAGELDSYWYLSAVHEILGDKNAAIEAVEYLAERLPENPVVLERLRVLRSGGTIEYPEEAL